MPRHNLSEQDIADLLVRVRAGDTEAFNAIIVFFYDVLIDFVASYTDSVDTAEDVLQEIFVRIWDQRERLDPTRPLRPFLFRIARNQALDQCRRKKTAAQYALRAAETERYAQDPELQDTALELSDLDAAVAAAIDTLPERCREIYLLSRRGDLSYTEIAGILGVSTSTVKTQMGRAVQALSRKLAPFLTLLLMAGRS